MVCCLIGAFLLGLVFRAARWTGRSVKALVGRKPAEGVLPAAPTPVYELPEYLTATLEDERVPQLV
ncbi:MAG: hypothetical protein ACRDJ1_06740 [Actinomycetota bacterium]